MFTLQSKEKRARLEREFVADITGSADNAVAEAKKIIESFNEITDEHYAALSVLGFHSAKDSIEKKKNISQIVQQAELLKKIKYYLQQYPFNRFISREDVPKICKKYNLYLGSVSNYIGEIPRKNQLEIVGFKMKYKDTTIFKNWEYQLKWHNPGHPNIELIKEELKKGETMVSGQNLSIIAPKRMFDMSGMKILNRTIVDKDPIVLQPVEGGYLIVSAWGMEASDELVRNPVMS